MDLLSSVSTRVTAKTDISRCSLRADRLRDFAVKLFRFASPFIAILAARSQCKLLFLFDAARTSISRALRRMPASASSICAIELFQSVLLATFMKMRKPARTFYGRRRESRQQTRKSKPLSSSTQPSFAQESLTLCNEFKNIVETRAVMFHTRALNSFCMIVTNDSEKKR